MYNSTIFCHFCYYPATSELVQIKKDGSEIGINYFSEHIVYAVEALKEQLNLSYFEGVRYVVQPIGGSGKERK